VSLLPVSMCEPFRQHPSGVHAWWLGGPQVLALVGPAGGRRAGTAGLAYLTEWWLPCCRLGVCKSGEGASDAPAPAHW
jgi:hypothetical protein